MRRKIVVLIEGNTHPRSAKTAINMVRYCPDEVVALLDSSQAGKTAGELLGVGGNLKIVASLQDAPLADTLLIGISPPGGELPAAWRRLLLEAARRGMQIVSGLHAFISDDQEIAQAAAKSGARILDVRKNNEREVAWREGINQKCLRIHTVGNDCNVGKMVVSLELSRALVRAGHDSKFVATGQTGIMIEGDGCPIDAVVADFVNGSAERLVLKNQHHKFLLIEGQGTLVHPMYSSVTLGLLHGLAPQGLIFCYEPGHTKLRHLKNFPIPPLRDMLRLYETMANLMHPCKVIGLGINSRNATAQEAAYERARVQEELGLPACDVIRDGPEPLMDAVLRYQQELGL
jgi:uncharacterized NAD-dependent epimerase/dehydratase family protein